MRNALWTWALGAFLCAGICAAQEPDGDVQQEMVVYGTKLETPLRGTTTQTIVITAEEIETYQWKTLADALHGRPGISLVRNGGEGTVTTLFVRGAKSENTLVLVDGVRMNDPVNVGRGYDFAHLSTQGIVRIELILGPQTALYGTDASSGVINIITEPGSDGFRQSLALEISDEDTRRIGADLGGSHGAWNYSLHGTWYASDYLSAQGDPGLAPLESDRFENASFQLQAGYRFSGGGETALTLSQVVDKTEIDAFDGDDPNYTNDDDQRSLGWRYRRNLWRDRWDLGLHFGYTRVERDSADDPDERHPETGLDARFEGRYTHFEWRNRFTLSEAWTLLAGASYEEEDGETRSLSSSSFGDFTTTSAGDTHTSGLFLHARYASAGGFSASVGLRNDDHSLFGSETTYRAGIGYAVDSADLRLRASLGTGFKAPSLYQLFSDFGNSDLEAETSEALEVGAAKGFAEGRGEVGLTWYRNEYKSLIEFFFDPATFASFYFNLDKAESDGFECYAAYGGERWRLHLAYDKMDANNVADPANPVPLIRRFDDKAALRFHFEPAPGWRLHAEALRYGESLDTDFNQFPAMNVALDGYTLVHAGVACTLAESWTFRLRGENLTDEDYVQVLGFNTPGRRIFASAQLVF